MKQETWALKIFVLPTTIWNTIFIFLLSYDNARAALENPYFWDSSVIANIAIIFTALGILLLFEVSFGYFVFCEIFFPQPHQNTTKVKNDSFGGAITNQLISPRSATFKVTDSKIVLIGSFVVSVVFARGVCEQIDYYFLDSASFNFGILFCCALFALLLFTYFVISLNTMVFKRLKWKHDIDTKSKTHALFWSFFVFINCIYFTKYIAIAMVYYPVESNDPATMMFLSNVITPAGKHPLEDPFFIALATFMDYVTFSIISVILAYLVFFTQTSKKHIMGVLEKINKILNNDSGSVSPKNPISEVIEKLFSKQLRNQSFAKYFSLFFYFYTLGIPALISLLTLFLIVYDEQFGTNTFTSTVHKYQYHLGAYLFFNLVLISFLEQTWKYYEYHLSYFISANFWRKSVKYFFSIHYPLLSSCSVAIFMRDVYRMSNEYGNIEAPENIQILQSMFFSIFVFGYLSMSVSSRIEDFSIKVFEIRPHKGKQNYFDSNSRKDRDYENLNKVESEY
ncbi:hypothetical protein [Methanosarcina mazei]|uniref:hypothetical protein n=1 Tax=Methanosarcina mazei TaxID=2209 RepID=UPI0012D474C3|nr:hypothetical protein [Methanosarcina mazei]